ncbi:hypothetical protein [Lacticaseibacillus suihuaensis]
MSASEIKKMIAYDYADVGFVVNGKQSGVASEVHDSVPTYQAWYGNATKAYDNIDDLMADEFFGGHSLTELGESGIDIDAI